MGERLKAPVTAHVLLQRAGEVLLLRRYRTGYEDGNYSVVAGHLEAGETVLCAAVREAEEEVGVRIRERDLRVVGVMQRKSDDERVDFFLAAPTWEGEVRNAEPDKCDDLIWRPLDDLPGNTIPYVRRAIANFEGGRWFDVFGWGGGEGALEMHPSAPTAPFEIRGVTAADLDSWVRLRSSLWPKEPPQLLMREAHAMIEDSGSNSCFLACADAAAPIGFIEVSLRAWAEGCRTAPVGYIEGWYVEPEWRRRGAGAALVQAGEAWARLRGCSEMASDAELNNTVSWLAHARLGYQEVERVVSFSKRLEDD